MRCRLRGTARLVVDILVAFGYGWGGGSAAEFGTGRGVCFGMEAATDTEATECVEYAGVDERGAGQ